MTAPLKLRVEIERWPLIKPFRITGHLFEVIEALVVHLERDGHRGRGEAVGVYYRSERVDGMTQQLEKVRPAIEGGASRETVQKLLPPGGARNALDCALWDLAANIAGEPVWRLAGLNSPKPLLTTFTCGADEPAAMAARRAERA